MDFATALLDHTRTSNELEVMLNHDPTNLSGPMFEHGERMHLNRLKLAIKLRQKKVWLSFDALYLPHPFHPTVWVNYKNREKKQTNYMQKRTASEIKANIAQSI